MSSSCYIKIERAVSGPSVVLRGWGLLEFDENGNEVVFGDAVEKNIVGAEVCVPPCVRSLSASSGTRDGRKPYYFMSDCAIQEGVLLFFKHEVSSGSYSHGSTIKAVGYSCICVR